MDLIRKANKRPPMINLHDILWGFRFQMQKKDFRDIQFTRLIYVTIQP